MCNLASIALPTFIDPVSKTYDFKRLHEVAKAICKNLNKIIDINYYPVEEARRSNFRHRPIGIVSRSRRRLYDHGVRLRVARGASPQRADLETIYHAALERSCELAQEHGTYETYAGSPASQGELQYDMWGVTPRPLGLGRAQGQDCQARSSQLAAAGAHAYRLDESDPRLQRVLRAVHVQHLLAPCARRRVPGGQPLVAPRARRARLWNDTMKNRIIAHGGSIQNVPGIPDRIKKLYKTVWEISQKAIIDMAADRGAFICQSQSLNIHLSAPTFGQLTSMHFYGWKKGLKTGTYYLRNQASVQRDPVYALGGRGQRGQGGSVASLPRRSKRRRRPAL